MKAINILDDTIEDFKKINEIFINSKLNEVYSIDDLKVIYTKEKLSIFLDMPNNTKTNMYTVFKRIRLYIINNNLCVNGVIKPDEKLKKILINNHKYNRITYNTLLKYIDV